MKWKSVSPDTKRRESPKFKSGGGAGGHGHYYRSFDFEHDYDDNYEYRPQYPQYQQFDQYDRVSSIEMRLKEMERRERELQRELEFYRNQRSGGERNENIRYEERKRDENVESNEGNPQGRSYISEDEDEDELYFYGGGRKKKIKAVREEVIEPASEPAIESIRHNENTKYTPDSSSDYDPVAFSDDSSSSWSSEEEEEEKVTKKQRQPQNTKVSKSPHPSAHTSAPKPKAYTPKVIDLDAPTYMKLPPMPIPSTWANIIHNPLKMESEEECHEIITRSIVESGDWQASVTSDVQGILMRPPFSNTFTINTFIRFMKNLLPRVMKAGYLFIWVEREELAQVIRASEEHLGFKYVENLCWIRRSLGNKIMKEVPDTPGGHGLLFYKSKMTLLILRKDPNNLCKLRHQRNPDCIIDFVGPGRMPDGRVYDVIETLLDGSRSVGPHLMHLWAGSSPTDRLVYQSRKHWIRVLEEVEDVGDIGDTGDIEDERVNEIIRDTVSYGSEPDLSETIEPTNDYNEPITTTDTELPTFKLHDTDTSTGISSATGTVTATYTSNTFDEDFCNFIICEDPI